MDHSTTATDFGITSMPSTSDLASSSVSLDSDHDASDVTVNRPIRPSDLETPLAAARSEWLSSPPASLAAYLDAQSSLPRDAAAAAVDSPDSPRSLTSSWPPSDMVSYPHSMMASVSGREGLLTDEEAAADGHSSDASARHSRSPTTSSESPERDVAGPGLVMPTLTSSALHNLNTYSRSQSHLSRDSSTPTALVVGHLSQEQAAVVVRQGWRIEHASELVTHFKMNDKTSQDQLLTTLMKPYIRLDRLVSVQSTTGEVEAESDFEKLSKSWLRNESRLLVFLVFDTIPATADTLSFALSLGRLLPLVPTLSTRTSTLDSLAILNRQLLSRRVPIIRPPRTLSSLDVRASSQLPTIEECERSSVAMWNSWRLVERAAKGYTEPLQLQSFEPDRWAERVSCRRQQLMSCQRLQLNYEDRYKTITPSNFQFKPPPPLHTSCHSTSLGLGLPPLNLIFKVVLGVGLQTIRRCFDHLTILQSRSRECQCQDEVTRNQVKWGWRLVGFVGIAGAGFLIGYTST